MKRSISTALIAALAASILLAACYIPSGSQTASVIFDFGGAPGVRAVGDTGTFDHARVYLVSAEAGTENAFYDFGDGEVYAQGAIAPDGTFTVEGIPTGTWNILLSLGSLETGTAGGAAETFYVQKWGESGAVAIYGGENSVSVGIADNPFTTSDLLFGKSIVGVTTDGGTVYTADSEDAYSGAGLAGLSESTPGALGDADINGISMGLDAVQTTVPYLSTTDGIRYFSTGVLAHGGLAGIPVLDAGAFDNGSGDTIVYYQREGGFGAANLSPGGSSADVDLSGVITGQPVLDFEIVDGAVDTVYFVTKLGSFALGEELLFGTADDLDAVFDLAVFFDTIGGTYYDITSIAYDPGGAMYIGTSGGMFRGTPTGADPAFALLVTVPGTVETVYDMIEVSAAGTYVAFISNLDLYVVNTDTDGLSKIPFYAGLPGAVSAMAWIDDDSLLISGSEGLVQLDM